MEDKEKVQSPQIKQEEIVPYVLLEQLLLTHKVAAKHGKAISVIILAKFILKFSKKIKNMGGKGITIKYGYGGYNPVIRVEMEGGETDKETKSFMVQHPSSSIT